MASGDATYKACDREIDPLREAHYHVIIANAFADLEDWNQVRRYLTSAEGWAYKARERMPEIAAMMRADITDLQKCAGNKARWEAKKEQVIPAVVDRVFKTFASCIRLKRTRESLPW